MVTSAAACVSSGAAAAAAAAIVSPPGVGQSASAKPGGTSGGVAGHFKMFRYSGISLMSFAGM